MVELRKFTLDGLEIVRGDAIDLARKMRRDLAEHDYMSLPYHAVLVNPLGHTVASV